MSTRGNRFVRRALISVFLAIIVLSALMIFLSQQKKEKEAEERSKRLVAIESKDQVSAIGIIKLKGGKKAWAVKLERQKDGSWLIVEPFSDIPKPYKVDGMLEHLTDELEDTFEVKDIKELKEYGMDSATQVYIYTKDGETFSFSIGKDNPISNSKYIRRDSEMMLGLLPMWKASYYELDTPGDLRLSRLVDLDPEDVQEIEFLYPERFKLSFENSKWYVRKDNRRFLASSYKVRKLIADLNNAEVMAWFDNTSETEKEKYLSGLVLHVKVKLEGKEKPIDIRIGRKRKTFFASVSIRKPLLALRDETVDSLVGLRAKLFLSKKVFADIDFDNLSYIEVKTPEGKEYKARRKGNKWSWVEGKKGTADLCVQWLREGEYEKELAAQDIYTKAEIYELTFTEKLKKKAKEELSKVQKLIYVKGELCWTKDGKVFKGLKGYLKPTKNEDKDKSSKHK